MRKNVMFVRSMGIALIAAIVIGTTPVTLSYAALNQKLYSYTTASTILVDDAKVKYVYNGKPVDLGKTPGVLTSNTVALAHHAKLFRDTLGLQTNYDSKKKTITFSDGRTTLVLTLGSKTAKVNGKSVTMNTIPMSVKYTSTGELALLVPSRFVAETFGFKYSWDSKTYTVSITKPLSLTYNNQTVNFTGTTGYVSYNGKNIDVSSLPMLVMNNTAMIQAYHVYKSSLGAEYKFTRSTGEIIIKKGSITLEMKLNSTKAIVNGKTIDCGMAPVLMVNNGTKKEAVMVPAKFVSSALGYDYNYSESEKTSQIKSSPNVGKKPNLALPLSLTYNNQTIDFTGTIGYVSYDGKNIDVSSLPMLLMNNTAMVQAYRVFKSSLGAEYTFTRSTGEITIKKGSLTLEMKLNSTKAIVNGKTIDCGMAPILMVNNDTKKEAVMVPAKFVSSALGYDYSYDSSKKTSQIKSTTNVGKKPNLTLPLSLTYNNQTVNFTGTRGYVSYDGKNIDVSSLPMLIMDNTAMIQAYRVFKSSLGAEYTFIRSTGQVIIKKGKLTLEMKLNSTKAVLNGVTYHCGTAPILMINNDTKKEAVMVPARFVSNALGYDYSYSDSKKTSQIKSSPNVGIKTNLTLSSGSTGSGGNSGSSGGVVLPPTTPEYQENQYFTWKGTAPTDLLTAILEAKSKEQKYQNTAGEFTVFETMQQTPSSDATNEFVLNFSGPIIGLTSKTEDHKVILTVESSYCNPMEYQIQNSLVSKLSVASDDSGQSVHLIFEGIGENAPVYDIIPLEDGRGVRIKFYPDVLTGLTAGMKDNGEEYISFVGSFEQMPQLTEDKENYYLTLNSVTNSIGQKDYRLNNANNKNQISMISLKNNGATSSVITISKPANAKKAELVKTNEGYSLNIQKNQIVLENTTARLLLPESVSATMISDIDAYYNKQIIIKLAGDHRKFYQEHPIKNVHSMVSSVAVSYSQNTTSITISTKKIQGYRYQVSGRQLLLTIDSPSKIYDKIVVLDPGHGGKDPGAVHGSTHEKTINYNVLNVYAKDYFQKAGIKAYYTRINDSYIPLDTRAAFSAQVEADLFLSVHADASSTTSAKGTTVYYSSRNSGGNKGPLTSKKLAQELVNDLSRALKTKNRGIQDKSYVVVRDNTVPAVLIELGFMTNPEDKAIITSASGQRAAAKSICDTVAKLFKTYPTNR